MQLDVTLTTVLRSFLRNVIGGLRLLTFRKVNASTFVPSVRHGLLFTVAAPLIWIAYDGLSAEEDPLDRNGVEEQIYRQPELLDRALADLAPQDPALPDVYFVGFAGYGDQEVFSKEASFARDALAQRYDLHQHSLILANSPEPARDALLASTTALRHSLDGVAQKMDVANDVLMLYITSHGSDDGSVAVSESGMPFNDLYVDDLKQALKESGIRWRVLIVSACYSGTFIEPLKDDYTIIFTAARADRTSFGCSDERDLTYFGEALFRDVVASEHFAPRCIQTHPTQHREA